MSKTNIIKRGDFVRKGACIGVVQERVGRSGAWVAWPGGQRFEFLPLLELDRGLSRMAKRGQLRKVDHA
jgi:hypothetical protein